MVSGNAAPQNIDSLMQQGLAAYQRKDIPAAIECMNAVLAIMPEHPDALNLRGTMYFLQGNLDRALGDQSAAVEIDPDFPSYRMNYALTLRQLQRFEDCEKQYRAILRKHPNDPKCNLHFGQLLYENLNRYADALPYLHLAVKMDPQNVRANLLYASCLLVEGQQEKALPYFLEVERLGQVDQDILCGIAACYYVTGRTVKAQEYCDKALKLNPDCVRAHFISGSILSDQGRFLAAVVGLKKALMMEPDNFEYRQKLIGALILVKDHEAAKQELAYWDHHPQYANHPIVLGLQMNYLFSIGDFTAMRKTENLLLKDFQNLDPTYVTGLSLLGLVLAEDDETSKKLFSYQRNWGKHWEKQVSRSIVKKRGLSGKRPRRIGLLSADFRDHSVGKFLLPLIEQMDAREIEFYTYSTLPGVNDMVHQHFQKKSAKFTDVFGQRPEDVAQIIAADNIEILIDLNGMTFGSHSQALAWRAAPVQMTWLGYPFSTGIKNCDYIVVDEFVNPENTDCMTETPLILPDTSYLCFGDTDPKKIGELPFDKNGYITFGSLNNFYKLGTRTVDLWRDVLLAVPNSRFLYIRPEFTDAKLCENILQSICMDNIDPGRIMLKPNYAPTHLEHYNDIDISLDTYPVTGGTTTVESLWMGVPVVSRFGSQIHQRVSRSILNFAGQGDLCVAGDLAYVELARNLASDPAKLREYRKNLRPQLMETSLIDNKKFLAGFAKAMLSV